MLLFLLSLAGVPPLAGFIGKLYIFVAAIKEGLYTLITVGLINIVISMYYYLIVVKKMYINEPIDPSPLSAFRSDESGGLCRSGGNLDDRHLSPTVHRLGRLCHVDVLESSACCLTPRAAANLFVGLNNRRFPPPSDLRKSFAYQRPSVKIRLASVRHHVNFSLVRFLTGVFRNFYGRSHVRPWPASAPYRPGTTGISHHAQERHFDRSGTGYSWNSRLVHRTPNSRRVLSRLRRHSGHISRILPQHDGPASKQPSGHPEPRIDPALDRHGNQAR